MVTRDSRVVSARMEEEESTESLILQHYILNLKDRHERVSMTAKLLHGEPSITRAQTRL